MSIPVSNADGDVSGSSIVPNITSGHHVLKIEQWSRTKTFTPLYSSIQSRSFRIAGCTWHIDLYPKGSETETASCITLYLVLDDRADNLSANATAAVTFGVLDPDADGAPMQGCTAAGQLELRPTSKCVEWGCFIDTQELDNSMLLFLKDDSFSVRCDITVVDVRPGRELVAVPPPDLSTNLHDLLSSGEGTDVRFRVGGEIIAAHRCLLAARSPVFKAGLFGAMRESSAAAEFIEVDGIRADVFRTLLRFIYTDSLPPQTKGQEDEDAAMAQHLLVAVDMYGIERLKLICEARLCGHVRVSTAATTLVLAEQHSCRGLKEVCFEFVRQPATLEAVKATDGFSHLAKSCPQLLPEMMLKFATWD